MIGLSKKERIIEFLLVVMNNRTYRKEALDNLIVDCIKPELVQEPIYAPDHIRRALVEFGYMERNPYTEMYTIKDHVHNLIEKHEKVSEKIAGLIDSEPESKIKCEFCEYNSKPIAMLNHYNKKHSFIEYFNKLKYECASPYYRI